MVWLLYLVARRISQVGRVVRRCKLDRCCSAQGRRTSDRVGNSYFNILEPNRSNVDCLYSMAVARSSSQLLLHLFFSGPIGWKQRKGDETKLLNCSYQSTSAGMPSCLIPMVLRCRSNDCRPRPFVNMSDSLSSVGTLPTFTFSLVCSCKKAMLI